MPMETFNYPYHVSEIRYPQSSTAVSFGKGYEFVSKPNAPDQLRFMLHFPTMRIWVNPNGSLNAGFNPTYNMLNLMNFYERHRLYEKFIYPSPIKGNVVVRFGAPPTFKPIAGGGGTYEPFTLELVLQP